MERLTIPIMVTREVQVPLAASGAIVRDASRYAIGDAMTARLKRGELKVSVDEVIADATPLSDEELDG